MTESVAENRLRRVRSFVRRPGRLTSAQQRAIEKDLPSLSLSPDLDDARLSFVADAPLILEIGFGNGEALGFMAVNEPQHNFLGIEVHEPGVGSLVQQLVRQEITNVRVAMRDAVEVLQQQVQPASLAQARIYFPDPWPKKRHHKRRLIQPLFVAQIAKRLQPGGLLHLATDWAPYAEWMLSVLTGCDELTNLGDPFVQRPAWRPETRFERRGLKRGHEIFDLLYERRS
ncbi:MAG: tRNA (guanosine(46)-N7)-methyltransferase TrmB [Wenzhouxiangella sp.]|jgi:tRNA (guanine-N7-)-methyltransferase|nr:tRNA (guanosine(46)-N7)-methyltransferase TrmB [Wenzhouxiangella sp.]